MARACCNSVRPACVGVTPWRPRVKSGTPSTSSMLRMRVEAAASAKCARSAPWVMLPASTTWRNRLRSARSKRIGTAFLRIWRNQLSFIAHCAVKNELYFRRKRKLASEPDFSEGVRVRCGSRPNWIGTPSAAPPRCDQADEHDGRHTFARTKRSHRAAIVAASSDLPTDADDDDVDRSSHHRL